MRDLLFKLPASLKHKTEVHRRTGRCGVLAIATWAAWFWADQGRLLTKKKEERKGRKGRFNIFATAGLRTQSTPAEVSVNTSPCYELFVNSALLYFSGLTLMVHKSGSTCFHGIIHFEVPIH